MECPVATQLLPEERGERNDPILVAFAIADDEFVLFAEDVVDGEAQALAQTKAAAVDELERGAITAKADALKEPMDLLTGEDGGKSVVIARANLGEESPVAMLEEIDEEEAGCGEGLTEGLGLPMLFELHEEEILTELGFGESGRIGGEVRVEEPDLTVIGVASAIGVVAQREEIGELSHGRVGMLVIDRINKVARRGTEVRRLSSCARLRLRLSGGDRSAFHARGSLQPHRKNTPVKTNPPKTSSKPRRVAA